MSRPAVLLVIASVAGAASMTTPARACSFAAPTAHVVDPAMQATDHTPPTLPPLPAPRITRGKGAERSGCGSSASSCDDLGAIVFQAQATDDMTPADRIGYVFTLESGSLPAGLEPTGAIEPQGDTLAFRGSTAPPTTRSRSTSRCGWWRSIWRATRARRRWCTSSTTKPPGSGCAVARRSASGRWSRRRRDRDWCPAAGRAQATTPYSEGLVRRATAAIIVGAVSVPAPAHACSFVGPTPYVVDASMQATDHVAPTLPPVRVDAPAAGRRRRPAA